MCAGSGNRRLAIRYLSGGDKFTLSKYPHTGPEHSLRCVFYSQDHKKSGLGAYSVGVVEETSDGDLKIRLKMGLRKKGPADGEQDEEATNLNETKISASPNGGRSKTAMTLLGLLHLLWSESRLNTWAPTMSGKRDLGVIHHVLNDTAAKVLTSRLRLAEALVVATSSANANNEKANDTKVTNAIKHGRRLVVVAPLAAWTSERENCVTNSLSIRGFNGVPKLIVDPELWADVKKRFYMVISGWRTGLQVVAIAQTDTPSSQSVAHVLDIALMLVSKEWVPVESGYEAKIEAKLRDESRKFLKPLRFDSTEELVFPDFWLTDLGTQQEFPMEVFGRSNPEYLARKQVKTDHYTNEYGPSGWWWWNAVADPDGQNIPAFPPAI